MYAGFQRQKLKTKSTIQGALEKALHDICGEHVSVIGASRTDAGVHSLGQVCHIDLSHSISCVRLAKALNSLLRPSIVVREAKEVSSDFHARYSAVNKAYAYFILNRPHASALFYPFLHWFPRPLDVKVMHQACHALLGKKDFTSFQASGTEDKNPVINVRHARCFHGTGTLPLPFSFLGNDVITFHIEARNFLHHMVRNLAGTLLEIGEGKRKAGDMNEILKARDRRRAGPTAPAKGLFLMRVDYSEEFQ